LHSPLNIRWNTLIQPVGSSFRSPTLNESLKYAYEAVELNVDSLAVTQVIKTGMSRSLL
ncbi:hypothetical protein A2U01_0030728, partial [Trifolium medium]|nr:hypothetical protein [Trifolium medium]